MPVASFLTWFYLRGRGGVVSSQSEAQEDGTVVGGMSCRSLAASNHPNAELTSHNTTHHQRRPVRDVRHLARLVLAVASGGARPIHHAVALLRGTALSTLNGRPRAHDAALTVLHPLRKRERDRRLLEAPTTTGHARCDANAHGEGAPGLDGGLALEPFGKRGVDLDPRAGAAVAVVATGGHLRARVDGVAQVRAGGVGDFVDGAGAVERGGVVEAHRRNGLDLGVVGVGGVGGRRRGGHQGLGGLVPVVLRRGGLNTWKMRGRRVIQFSFWGAVGMNSPTRVARSLKKKKTAGID